MGTAPVSGDTNSVGRRQLRTSTKAASHFLGMPFARWAGIARERGMTWSEIAEELRDASGGIVDVSRETVRSWYLSEVVPALSGDVPDGAEISGIEEVTGDDR